MSFLVPSYREGTLADVVPSLLAGLEVPDMTNVLGLPRASKVCLLLLDGLGWQLLRSHASEAPFLTSLAAGREPITAGFPATTAASIAALGTGLSSGEHGLVGYTFASGTMNCSTRWDGTDMATTGLWISAHGSFPSGFSHAGRSSNGPQTRE